MLSRPRPGLLARLQLDSPQASTAQCLRQSGEPVDEKVPDDFAVDVLVVVCVLVSGSCQLFPGQVGSGCLVVVRQLRGGDIQVDHRHPGCAELHGVGRIEEGVLPAGDHPGGRVDDCAHLGRPVVVVLGCRHHSGTASALARLSAYAVLGDSETMSTGTPTISSTAASASIRSNRSKVLGNSAIRSRSLPGPSSPRATDPNTRMFSAPYLLSVALIAARTGSSRNALGRTVAKIAVRTRSSAAALPRLPFSIADRAGCWRPAAFATCA